MKKAACPGRQIRYQSQAGASYLREAPFHLLQAGTGRTQKLRPANPVYPRLL